MADTTFVDNKTVIEASWLNDVNDAAYSAIGDGTNAPTTPAQVKANLDLEIGTNLQAWDAGLDSISGLTTSADKMIYTTASDTYAVTGLSALGRTLIDSSDTSEVKDTLRLQVDGITALKALAPVSGERVWLNYHTTEGDGGRGVFRGITGAAAGTYTDDNGVTIVPAGGDGSAAWIREFTGDLLIGFFGGDPSASAATNDTAISNAIATATPASSIVFYATSGGKSIRFDEGTYEIASKHVFPEWVNVLGGGNGLTIIKCTTASSGFQFGTDSSSFGAAERGGSSGGFVLEGNSVSLTPLHIGFVVEREFSDINVINGVKRNILIEAAQNCNYYSVNAQHKIEPTISTGSISAAGTTLTIAGNFLDGDGFLASDATRGRRVTVAGAGVAGADLQTTITAYTSPTQVTVADAASTTVSGATVTIGRGSNIVFDYGAGNNRFYGPEINRTAEYNVEFIQSGASPAGGFSVPTDNTIVSPMIERGYTNSQGSIYHGAGRNNRLITPDISLTGQTLPKHLVKVRKDGAGASTLFHLIAPTMSGTAAQTICFDVDDAADVVIDGRALLENNATGFIVGDSSAVHVIGEIVDSAVTTIFANQSGGTSSQDQLIYSQDDGVIRKFKRSAAASIAFEGSVDGESFARFQMLMNGLSMGPGSSAPDVTLARGSSAGVPAWSMLAPLIMFTGNVNFSFQTGAPAGWPAFPNGSAAIRVDGAAGTFLYGRIGGAWVALA